MRDTLRSVLKGRRILLVGGLARNTPHFRQAVESRGGAFLHHDGGMEESIERLTGLLRTADAVLFPTDYMSHGALRKVKELCRRFDTPYVPLRASGVAAFAGALDTLGAAAP